MESIQFSIKYPMRLVLINSFGPMGSSVVASIIEKLGYINLPIRKRNFHEYLLNKRSLSDPYFKNETIRIIKSFEQAKNIGGTNIFARNEGINLPRVDTKKNFKALNKFQKQKFESFSEMYFESMMLFNKCLIYKDIIENPKGVIELSVNLHKHDANNLYESYKKEFKDIKIINLSRDFEDLINSMVSQNYAQKKKESHHYRFNIVNYKNAYLEYLNTIKVFEGLNLQFKQIFQPNTKGLFFELSNYLEENQLDYQKINKQNFDLYGKITNFDETFTSKDTKINYIFPFIKKLVKFFYISQESKIKNFLMIIIFQIFYLFSMLKFKIKYKNKL